MHAKEFLIGSHLCIGSISISIVLYSALTAVSVVDGVVLLILVTLRHGKHGRFYWREVTLALCGVEFL